MRFSRYESPPIEASPAAVLGCESVDGDGGLRGGLRTCGVVVVAVCGRLNASCDWPNPCCECGSEYADPNTPLLKVYADAVLGGPSAVGARAVTGRHAYGSAGTPPVEVEVDARVEVEAAAAS